jgi:hypothetical protein
VELDDAAWALLHELRLRGTVTDVEEPTFELLASRGFAVRKRTSVLLTPAGREVHTEWARCEVGSTVEDSLRRSYERFLPMNADLLRVCNDWQLRSGGVPNDHTDVEYDWAVIDRLRELHDRTSPITRTMAGALERFTPYRARLRTALQRVEDGANEWFTSPRIDSYHTVWMQMHEDLLLALGIDRASEETPAP